MSLIPGTRLGVYEITAQIGEGGMGQVYRATDTRLKRQVAIKVLPPALAADRDRLARFQREAEVLASLNHPHIAGIHGLEESGGVTALVMELVEGDDLSQRIARGAIPLDEALPIAKQIADALEAAHEQGIIHRDLKPANIKVRPDGTVKVLDFGLAKAMDPAGSSPSMSMSPTITTPAMTQAGMILGTAAYMSPEQARGKTVDKRADIWAFGAVLFEMLTGQRAFPGEDLTDTLAAVVKLDPKWDAIGADVPARVRQVLRVCLQKDPRQRAQAAGDVRLALEGAFETAVPQTTATSTTASPRGRLAWVVAAVALLGMVAMTLPTVRYLRETPLPPPPETRTDIVTPATDRPTDFALSPDGRQLVFVATGDGVSRLWVRSLATTTAQPLAGTESATSPFWAPDSRSIGFSVGPALKRLDLNGGAPQMVAMSMGSTMQGGTWNADDVVVFAPSATGPLMRVAATGGTPVVATTLSPGQQGHFAPSFLPDGRRFLYSSIGGPGVSGIYMGALDGGAPVKLTSDLVMGTFLPSRAWRVEVATDGGTRPAEASSDGGWLLWVRGSALVAQRLDLGKAALTGEPVTVADGLSVRENGRAPVSVAAGMVAYRPGEGSRRQLTWVDRSGTARGTVGDPDGNRLNNPRVSPDGRLVVVGRAVQGNLDLWLLDGTRTSRFTFDPAADVFPVWSPDGTRIVFRSSRSGGGDLYQKFTSGAGQEELLVTSDGAKTPMNWSPDGRFVLYHATGLMAVPDLWVVPMDGDRTPSVFLKTPFFEARGVFSPDGRWVAYQSNESGRMEVYVRPFVPPSPGAAAGGLPVTGGGSPAGGQWQVSSSGGIMPLWRPDGKELYYLNPAGAMVAAPITITGATLAPGAPVVLFPTHIVDGGVDTQSGRQYDVAPDGRFLINTMLDSAAAPITLIQNWNPEAQK